MMRRIAFGWVVCMAFVTVAPQPAQAFPGQGVLRKVGRAIKKGTKNAAGEIWNGTKWVSKKIWDAENKGQGRG